MGFGPVMTTRLTRVRDTDRLILAACLGLPLAVLVVFFANPLATVVVHSFTEPDGRIGFGNYVSVVATPIAWS